MTHKRDVHAMIYVAGIASCWACITSSTCTFAVGVLLEGTVQGRLSRGEAGPRRAGGPCVGHQRGDEKLCVTGVL